MWLFPALGTLFLCTLGWSAWRIIFSQHGHGTRFFSQGMRETNRKTKGEGKGGSYQADAADDSDDDEDDSSGSGSRLLEEKNASVLDGTTDLV
jgi:hypothetical protein